MPTFPLTAINVGSFSIGEADKVLWLFSRENGLTKGVAKGARKPGAKISGKAEALCVNNLLMAKGKSLDIITQAESVETFPKLRVDLEKLTYGLYFAELTKAFGVGLEEDSGFYFELLVQYLKRLSNTKDNASALTLEFELALLNLLGFQPELKVCVMCREPLTEYSISAFVLDMGGICCKGCAKKFSRRVSESYETADLSIDEKGVQYPSRGTFVTPLVWKYLSLASAKADQALKGEASEFESDKQNSLTTSQKSSLAQARNVAQKYLEDRAGHRMKSLDLLKCL